MRASQIKSNVFNVVLIWLFASVSLVAQSLVPEEQFTRICHRSLKGIFVEGVVSDANVTKVENITLDFKGTGLPNRDTKDLLPGYSVAGVGQNGVHHSGSLQVLSSYAWAGGDSHTWIAYLPSASWVDRIQLKKGKKTISNQPMNIHYGEHDKFKSFDIEKSKVTWMTAFNSFEILISTNSGVSWASDPMLRVPNGSVSLDGLIHGYQGEIYFMLIASEKSSMFVKIIKAKIE